MAVTTRPPSANSGSGFTNPTYAYSDDTNYATSASDAQTHIYSGYGFTLDALATITGVRVNVLAYCGTNDKIKIELSADGGSSWLATSDTPTLGTGSPADHWVDATAWTTWTPAKINSDQIRARVTHVKTGGVDTVYLDYLPIEVTWSLVFTKTGTSKARLLKNLTKTGTTKANIAAASIPYTKTGTAKTRIWAPWLANYSHRKRVPINGSSAGQQINYQLKLTVHSGSGTDSSTDVYLGGHAFSWGGTVPNDLRFTKINGTTELDYWIESSDANSAVVYVEVDTIPASPSTTAIFMYFGKYGDTTTSNRNNTFSLRDLYLTEASGTGNPAVASAGFTAKDFTRLTKANGSIQLEMKCDLPAQMSSNTQLELTSSGGPDTNEWATDAYVNYGISTVYQTFEILLAGWATTGGELNVAAINFVRWYNFATSGTITIAWRNAKLRGPIYVSPEPAFGTWEAEETLPNYTKTGTAKANIITSTSYTKTSTAKADIFKNITKTGTAKGRITKSYTKTAGSITARIHKSLTKTGTALAKMVGSLNKTGTAKARVQVHKIRTAFAKADIYTNVTKTSTAKGAIAGTGPVFDSVVFDPNVFNTTGNITKTGSAKARITKNITKSGTAKANISGSHTKTATAKADIKKNLSKTAVSLARILKAAGTKTATAKARILHPYTKTAINVRARIFKNITKSSTAKAYVITSGVKTGTAKARIFKSFTKTAIGVKARILKAMGTKSGTAKARVTKNITRTSLAKADIKNNVTKTSTAKARIVKSATKTSSTIRARITKSYTKTAISVKARILQHMAVKTSTAKARVNIHPTKTTAAKARISKNITKTSTSKADIFKNVTRTGNARAYMVGLGIKSGLVKARIVTNTTKTGSTVARILRLNSKSGTAKARILRHNSRYIASIRARILKSTTKTTTNVRARIIKLFTKTSTAKGWIPVWPREYESNKGFTGLEGGWGVGGSNQEAQAITPQVTRHLTDIFLAAFEGGGSGNLYIKVYLADVNHKPTGPILSSGQIPCSTIINAAWYRVPMSGGLITVNGIEYVFTISADSTVYPSDDESKSYTRGIAFYSTDGGATWEEDLYSDRLFRLYGSPGFASTAKARIQKSQSKTATAKSRITKLLTRTGVAKASISNNRVKTGTVKAWINNQVNTTKTGTARARIDTGSPPIPFIQVAIGAFSDLDLTVLTQPDLDTTIVAVTDLDVTLTGGYEMVRRDFVRPETVPLRCTVKDPDTGNLVDPSGSVLISIYTPTGTLLVDSQAMTKLSTGVYIYYWQSVDGSAVGWYRAMAEVTNGAPARLTIENGGFNLS